MSKNKRILFLFPYPSGTAASQRFRFEQYFHVLEEKGVAFKKQPFLDSKTWKILYKPGHYFQKGFGILKGFLRRFGILFSLHKYDFVFIHREASPLGPPIFEWLIAKVFRKKIVYDLDDAIWLENTSKANKLVKSLKFSGKTPKICRWAYKVSGGNWFVVEYAKKFNDNVVFNSTTIDTENLHNPQYIDAKPQTMTIGWTGTHSTMKYLDVIVPVLQKLEKEYDFEFLVISNQKPDFDLKSLKYVPWNKETEIKDLEQMHFGVMPLREEEWANGKCGFKAFQYMSLSIPAIITPIGIDKDLVRDGENGFLANNQEDWEKILRRVFELSDVERKNLGKQARDSIIQKHSVLSNKENFVSLFS